MTSGIKQEAVRAFITSKRPDIAGLTETRLKTPFKIKNTHSI